MGSLGVYSIVVRSQAPLLLCCASYRLSDLRSVTNPPNLLLLTCKMVVLIPLISKIVVKIQCMAGAEAMFIKRKH